MSSRIVITLNNETLDALNEIAKANAMTKSSIVKLLVDAFVIETETEPAEHE